ncbi:hypothetical protein UFOVP1382_81 [uncultured Caudovirales phage]|uniref:Uncharacterized protein n=1 Tax=uncultured Caudovirales phage TaxID=2100421 RepID=A0A6J5S592_9CAUD|nr:hypothetical protein UFOVP1382_81 [uncultured Caudovirales phage]
MRQPNWSPPEPADLKPVHPPGIYFACLEHDGEYTPKRDWSFDHRNDGECARCEEDGEDSGVGEIVEIVALTDASQKDSEWYAGRVNALVVSSDDREEFDAWRAAGDGPTLIKPCRDKPCAKCPFLRNSLPGYLGSYEGAEEFAATHIQGEVVNPCHVSMDHEDPEWLEKFQRGEMGHRCRGQADFFKNNLKLPRNPLIEASPERNPDVFNWQAEFVEHHRPS